MSPWWVSAIKTVGVPSTMAGVLLWWVLHTLSPVLFDVKGMMEAHVIQAAELQKQNDTMIKILRGNCLNGAGNDGNKIDRCNQ